MRSVDGPADGREVILVMEDCNISVQRMISGVTDLAIDEENLLMNLEPSVSDWRAWEAAVLEIACSYPRIIGDRHDSWRVGRA